MPALKPLVESMAKRGGMAQSLKKTMSGRLQRHSQAKRLKAARPIRLF